MPLMTGAIASPRHKLAAATPHAIVGDTPPQFSMIPTRISFWGNNVDGDCVTAEEAFAKACNTPEIFVTDQEVKQWAGQRGFLNGAMLTDVMDAMIRDGITASDGVNYKDGPYSAVDWTNDAVLRNAIYQGPIKIAIAHGQLGNTATPGSNGWLATGFYQDHGTDHCVCLCGYGTIAWLLAQFGKSVPAGVDGSKPAYLLFTWDSIGVIDQPSMVAITTEAWLRNPTTVGQPTPSPTPSPVPPAPPAPPSPPVPVCRREAKEAMVLVLRGLNETDKATQADYFRQAADKINAIPE